MPENSEIKKALLQLCFNTVNARIDMVESELASIQQSRANETKSSAGDKFETGRAMLQQEEDNNKKQLANALMLKNVLQKVKPEHSSKSVDLGAVVQTDSGNYFVSTAIGKLELNGTTYFAISQGSPIGMALNGKQAGETVSFNNRNLQLVALF